LKAYKNCMRRLNVAVLGLLLALFLWLSINYNN